MSTYGRPIIAIPLTAVSKVERIKFDIIREDIRFENLPPTDPSVTLTKHMFEFLLKDEFLPIYTHHSYTKIFKDTSISMELSPDKRRSTISKRSQMSPFRQESSTISKRSSQLTSPGAGGNLSLRSSHVLDMHKKTGAELRQSPSKNSKITMRYINCYADVGP